MKSMEKGGNQGLAGVNVDTVHQETERKRGNSLEGRWLVLS